MRKLKILALFMAVLLTALLSGQSVYAACSHKWVYQSTKPSTCMTQGYVEYKCSKCGAIRRDPLALSPHVYVWKYYTTWHKTCAHDTFDEYHKRCKWCNYRDPLTHCTDMNHRGDGYQHRFEYEGWVNGYEYVTGAKPADKYAACTSPGYRWESSSPCGYGHGNPPWGEAPYCTLVAHRKVIIPALGHSWGTWRLNRIVSLPSGSSPGIMEMIRTCTRCYTNEYRYESYYDQTAPTIYLDPESSDWTTQVSVNMNAYDTGGSGLEFIGTILSDSLSVPPASADWTYGLMNSPGICNWSSAMVIDLENQWYLHAKAYDYCGNQCEVTVGPYRIDRTPPVITASDGGVGVEDDIVRMTVSASDNLSGVRQLAYCWSDTTSRPDSGWTVTASSECIAETACLGRTMYLHTEALDKAGNTGYTVFGPYEGNTLEILGVTISGTWNHWRGQKDIFGRQLAFMPHRFLSYEKIKVQIQTRGYAEKIIIRLSPELEAMRFTDANGNTYQYRDKTGYDICFPVYSTVVPSQITDENTAIWEYILPLADSTMDWDDQRLNDSYYLDVTAFKGSASVSTRIDDIDITGNVYDLIHMQPVR